MDAQKVVQKAKSNGLLVVLHFIAAQSLFVKGIIVSAALLVGYGSAAFYKKDNVITQMAHDIVDDETGIDVDFVKPEKSQLGNDSCKLK